MKYLREYDAYIRKKYNAEPGYITMNMPALLDALNSVGIENPIICSSINKIGFRMIGGNEIYEKYLKEKTVQTNCHAGSGSRSISSKRSNRISWKVP